MKSMILSVEDFTFDCDTLLVTAVVEDARITRQQTEREPAEYGPGLCRGTMHFCADTLIPATDAELMQMLSDRIDDWALIPTDSDFEEVSDEN
jgi:hypothetical protein